ncbi:MAG TPA: serine/threonine-protein kinase, partial [Candidatus Binataceae bacterium]|nr:serine/threonine-protein kinase [Candidatus Binataceae bacterium]
MAPERWRRIEALYHSALERDPPARAAFLDGACGNDNELRREVESLLAEAPTGQGLLDQPAAALLAESATVALKAGTLLGPYQIEALIGEGGMGKVYKTRDTRLGRTVAIKTSSARFSERFAREARAVAALNHPHICHLYDVGPNYLVMEYIEGTPIKGPLPVEEVLKYAEQICDALEAAHSGGIVHRDLKPGNILVSKQGIKLLDFGLAQMEAGPNDSNAPTMTQMTQTGALMGTPAYMAPEQWEGKRADARSDIYSFGCVLYEMLTGKRASGDRAATTRLSADVSPELGRILNKCLEIDPDLRYRHASEIRTDLVRLKRDSESLPAVAAAPPKRKWWIPSTAAALVAASAVAWFAVRPAHAKLTDHDTIVVADFVNKTGDPAFDDTLRQGLIVQLQQSPFLSLISDQKIRATLKLMGKPADDSLTGDAAREVCERVGARAVLTGSITSLGTHYVMNLRADGCANGDALDNQQADAAG